MGLISWQSDQGLHRDDLTQMLRRHFLRNVKRLRRRLFGFALIRAGGYLTALLTDTKRAYGPVSALQWHDHHPALATIASAGDGQVSRDSAFDPDQWATGRRPPRMARSIRSRTGFHHRGGRAHHCRCRRARTRQTQRPQEFRMTRHLLYAFSLIGIVVLLSSSAEAATAAQCEDRAANCVGRCADFTGGAGDLGGHQNKCMRHCDQQVTKCLIRSR